MPRGRQYYDPILQTGAKVEGAPDLSRIELFPIGQDSTSRLPEEIGKWVGRKVEPDGTITGYTPGDFDHDRALTQAQQIWPGLEVYELRSEIEDSTWEGTGPSPRLWQGASDIVEPRDPPPALEVVPQPTEEQVSLRLLPVTELGSYVLLSDICNLLEMWAVSYEVDKNPSGALALREAVDALKDVG